MIICLRPPPLLGFCLGWSSNFVGSETGQIQSVKLLQNMVTNRTQHPHPLPATHCLYQCCGSGSGIRDPGLGASLTPGSGMGESQHQDPGSGIRDEQPGSYFLELRNHFFAFLELKYLNSLRIRDPGWKKVGSGIRDKHSESATLETRTVHFLYTVFLLEGCIRTEVINLEKHSGTTSDCQNKGYGILCIKINSHTKILLTSISLMC